MSRSRSPLRNWLEYCAARGVLFTLEVSPRPLAEVFARCYAKLLALLLPRLGRAAMHNLGMAMPDLPAHQHRRIVEGVFRSIGRLLVAFAKFPQINSGNVGDWIRYEGYEHFEQAIQRGRGVLFATAHLGNWELSAYAHALMSGPMGVVVRPLDNPRIDSLIEARRVLSGNWLIEKKDFARGILKALAQNQAVGILIDQNASLDNGVFVDFFDIPACATTGLAKLAAHSGAAVIPGFALWSDEEHRYVLRFYPPVDITGDVAADTQALQRQLEGVIRQYPDQWLWIHRRWKTRPPGEKALSQ